MDNFKNSKAIASHGMHPAFTRGLLEQLAAEYRMGPCDWDNLAKTVLDRNPFLQFRRWQDEAQQQERRSCKTDLRSNISTAQLGGQGAVPAIQANSNTMMKQPGSECLRAWDRAEGSGEPHQSFLKICQGSHEAYRLHSSVD